LAELSFSEGFGVDGQQVEEVVHGPGAAVFLLRHDGYLLRLPGGLLYGLR